jgi:hypothetical protein
MIECMECDVFTDEVEECEVCKMILCFSCHSEHEQDKSIEHTRKHGGANGVLHLFDW